MIILFTVATGCQAIVMNCFGGCFGYVWGGDWGPGELSLTTPRGIRPGLSPHVARDSATLNLTPGISYVVGCEGRGTPPHVVKYR